MRRLMYTAPYMKPKRARGQQPSFPRRNRHTLYPSKESRQSNALPSSSTSEWRARQPPFSFRWLWKSRRMPLRPATIYNKVGGGHAIVSADDTQAAIIGFSDSGHLESLTIGQFQIMRSLFLSRMQFRRVG